MRPANFVSPPISILTQPIQHKIVDFPFIFKMICYVYFDERQKGSLEINIVLNLILLIYQDDIPR